MTNIKQSIYEASIKNSNYEGTSIINNSSDDGSPRENYLSRMSSNQNLGVGLGTSSFKQAVN